MKYVLVLVILLLLAHVSVLHYRLEKSAILMETLLDSVDYYCGVKR